MQKANPPMKQSITYSDAMEVQTQDEADAVFDDLVLQCMAKRPCGRSEAEKIQRMNLGYYAGYYDDKTRERIERLYHCEHPIFGAIAEKGQPTSEEAFKLGMKMAKRRP